VIAAGSQAADQGGAVRGGVVDIVGLFVVASWVGEGGRWECVLCGWRDRGLVREVGELCAASDDFSKPDAKVSKE
jgi:hypothetical protein